MPVTSRLHKISFYISVWGILFVCLIYLQKHLPFTPRGDEGYLSYITWRINQGDILYKNIDLYSYFPGLFHFLAFFQKLSPKEIWGFRVPFALFFSFSTLLIFNIAQKLGPRWSALFVTTIFLFTLPNGFRSHKMIVPLAALFFSLLHLQNSSRYAFFGLGISTGLGLALRFDGAIISAVLSVTLLVLEYQKKSPTFRSSVLNFSSGLCSIVLPLFIFLHSQGELMGFLRQLMTIPLCIFNRGTSEYRIPAPSLFDFSQSISLKTCLKRTAFGSLFYGAVSFFIVLISLFIYHFIQKKQSNQRLLMLGMILLWFSFNFPQFAWERPNFGHLSERMFSILVLIPFIIDYSLKEIENTKTQSIAFQCLLATAVIYPLGYLLYNIAAKEGIASIWKPTKKVVLLNGKSFFTPQKETWPALANQVIAMTNPGESVASLPSYSGLNFVSERRLPGPTVYVLPHNIRSPKDQLRYLTELRNDHPRILIYNRNESISQQENGLLKNFAPFIHQSLMEEYRPDATNDLLFLRIDAFPIAKPLSSRQN